MNEDNFGFYEHQMDPRKRKCLDVVELIDQSDINFLQKISQKQSIYTVTTSSANIDIVIGFESDTSTSLLFL